MTVTTAVTGLGWPEPGRSAEESGVDLRPDRDIGDGLGWPDDADDGAGPRPDEAGSASARAQRSQSPADTTTHLPATESAQVLTATDIVTDRIAEVGDLADMDTPIAHQAAAAVYVTTRRREPLPAPASTRVMVVANQKGGVGKTTTAVNVAAAMASNGLRVLVIDLDPQGNASTALGIDHHADIPSSYDVLVEETALADVIVAVDGIDGLWCVPATIDLAGAEIELVSLVARESRLRKSLTAHLAALPENASYDYVLIDCPPSLGLLTVNALVGGDEVFIPIQCEYYALEGLSQLLKNIDLVRAHLNPVLAVTTILLTMYDGRTRLAAQVAEEVRRHFGETVLRTTIPRSVRISEAPSYGQTVMTYDPGSSGALSYLEAAREMAERGAKPSADPTGHITKENP
jgi:chromosome partitioning protein